MKSMTSMKPMTSMKSMPSMKSMTSYMIAVAGGGASGMIAAITAAGKIPGSRILLIERGARVGRKLLATGNGRCNISNRGASIEHYHGAHPEFVLPALGRFPVERVEEVFGKMGLPFAEEENGKLFPMSLQAAAVVDVLRMELERLGIETLTGTEVSALRREMGGFRLRLTSENGEEEVFAEKLILSCGGEASAGLGGCTGGYKLLQSLGHTITPRMAGIVQLKADMTGIKGLSGSKFQTVLTLLDGKRVCRKESGELLFTDYGVSGPPVLLISEAAVRLMKLGKTPFLSVDFLPEISYPELLEMLIRRKELHPERKLEDYFTGFIPKRLGQCILKSAGAAPLSREAGTLGKEELKKVAALLKAFPIRITGDNGLKNAQVTIGGADTGEFDPESMQSKKAAGLFVTGELYDIDGDCGGFNLQWAWSSGMLAAESAVRSLGRGQRAQRSNLFRKGNEC